MTPAYSKPTSQRVKPRAAGILAGLVVSLAFLGPDFASATLPSPGPAFASDDFNAPNLNTSIWTFIDPRGDATIGVQAVSGGDGRLAISLPSGASHDVWVDGNFAPRIMQPARDTDFGIEAKFESQPNATYQMQGILVQQGDLDYLRFDFYSVGPMTKIFAAAFTAGAPSVQADSFIIPGTPLYMRIERSGDVWTQLYSYDGASWITSATFTHRIAVSSVGAFFGNNPPSAPGFTGTIDYFFNTAARIDPEDGGVLEDRTPPLVYRETDEAAEDSLRVRWATDEAAGGMVEYGLTATYGMGAVSQSGYGTNHDLLIQRLQSDSLYHYRIHSSDENGNETLSRDHTIRTAAAVLSFPVVDIWYGSQQVFGNIGRPQRWVDIPGHVSGTNQIVSLSYKLNGGPAQTLGIGPNSRRLSQSGDFNVEIDFAALLPGLNHVVITATDSLSQSTVRSMDVDNQTGNTWPGTSTIHWANITDIQDAVQVVDGLWTIQSQSVRPVQIGYDRLLDIGE